MLFGSEGNESGDGRNSLLLLIAGLIGGAVSYVVGVVLKVRAERKTEHVAEEAKITDHLQKLIDRLDREKAEQSREIEVKEEQAQRLLELVAAGRVRQARLREHVRYLESVLARNKITYEEFTEDCEPGSQTHEPLPHQPPAAP